MKNFFAKNLFLVPNFAALLLCACGGGGSTDPAQAVLSDAQGRWHGSLSLSDGTSPSASTLVLPDGQTWIQFTTAGGERRLAHGTLTVNGLQWTGNAKLFELTTGNVLGNLTWTASATAGARLTVNSSNATQLGNFTSTSFLSQNAPSISTTGVWSDQLITPTMQWTITAEGNLSGYGNGCTLTGQVLRRADSAAVADVQFSETCAGASTSWTGVSLNGSTSNSLKFTLTTTDDTKAVILELVK